MTPNLRRVILTSIIPQNPDNRRSVAHRNCPGKSGHRLYLTGYQLSKRQTISTTTQYLSLVGVMATSAAFMMMALIYTIFFMREKKQEKKISAKDVLNLSSFLDGMAIVFRKRERGAKTVIITIIFICILCQFSWGTRFDTCFLKFTKFGCL